jgi:segregation and condensation protein B
VKSLNETYEQTGRSFRIEAVSGGFRVMTLPKFAPQIAVLHRRQASAKLSRASVETLAIIAYKQPITRAELEAIRGVSCGEVLKSLIDRRLVTIKGRAEELGRPMLYGTTKTFLDHFGLASVKDLPTLAELKPVS